MHVVSQCESKFLSTKVEGSSEYVKRKSNKKVSDPLAHIRYFSLDKEERKMVILDMKAAFII